MLEKSIWAVFSSLGAAHLNKMYTYFMEVHIIQGDFLTEMSLDCPPAPESLGLDP